MPAVLSDTLARRLQKFLDANKDATSIADAPHPAHRDKPIEEGSTSFKDKDDKVAPLNAPTTELSYELCGNRVRRNFLRHYLINVKAKKEVVTLNEDGILVTRFPYLRGTIEIELRPDGHFECFLLGRDRLNRFPFSFEFVTTMTENGRENNLNNGRVNGLPKDLPGVVMYINKRHAVSWFRENNRFRRFANIPQFCARVCHWANIIREQKEERQQRALARKENIDRMISEAAKNGYQRLRGADI